ncbi:hypothetical protein [Micromonospora sp. AMSO31t]|uniref:hypothetical protein n=1 Tax=Micromonospora sp. AMSO31t TaxID=2650566 RepID=UPI00124B8282|nr:hypothetical protein [Micromonospora sp. AMSO31t]KAB1916109.1 hypothetical protein F8274_01220 [Micromonospora sp. AMSO31t]
MNLFAEGNKTRHVIRLLAGTTLSLVAVAAAAAVAVTPAQASTLNGEITRDEILDRAQNWVDRGITYTQTGTWATDPDGDHRYRRDCSGLVSMVWHLSDSYVTSEFMGSNAMWSTLGSINDFKPGDAMVRTGHMELFAHWKDPGDHTKGAYVYSFNSDGQTVQNPYADNNEGARGFNGWSDLQSYKPIRRTRIVSPPAVIPPSYALAGDWFGTGEATPAVVQRNGAVWEWHIKRTQSSGFSDLKFSYGDADMVPVAGDWDGDGRWTPGVVANEVNSRRWYLKNSLSGGVSDVDFLYGGKDAVPVVGDWDGNGTSTPGVVSADSGAWKWELRNANSGGGVSNTLRYGNVNTWPVTGDWDGNGTWTPAVVDDADGPRRWFLKNDLTTDGLADVQFNFGSHGTYPVPGDWNGATAATEPGIVANYDERMWRWYLKDTVSGGVDDNYFDYGNDAPYPYTF